VVVCSWSDAESGCGGLKPDWDDSVGFAESVLGITDTV
jgi:hypothetical protein